MSKTDIKKYNRAVVITMLDNVTTAQEKQNDLLLEVNDMNFYYNKKKVIIENLNFKLYPGEIVGISGENGAGKSTLMKIISFQVVFYD